MAGRSGEPARLDDEARAGRAAGRLVAEVADEVARGASPRTGRRRRPRCGSLVAVSLEHLWAGWRREYIVEATARERAGAVARRGRLRLLPPGGERCALGGQPGGVARRAIFVVMNAYPYASGHVLVLPFRHVGRWPT